MAVLALMMCRTESGIETHGSTSVDFGTVTDNSAKNPLRSDTNESELTEIACKFTSPDSVTYPSSLMTCG